MYTSLLQKIMELAIVVFDEHAACEFFISPTFPVKCRQLMSIDWLLNHRCYKVQYMLNSFKMGWEDAVIACDENTCEGLSIGPRHFQRFIARKLTSH